MEKYFKNTKNKSMIFVVSVDGKNRKERFINSTLMVTDEATLKALERTEDFKMGYIVECDEKWVTAEDKKKADAEKEKLNKAVSKATAEKDAEIEKLKAQLAEKQTGANKDTPNK